LVTSRPETHIRDTPVSDTALSTILRLHTVNKEQVTADIRLYVGTRLSSSPQLRARFTADDADMLARLCDGLFIVAATALQYALGAGVDAAVIKFKTLLNASRDGLSSNAAAPLDRMYAVILSGTANVDGPETDELVEKLRLLAAILSSRMPLSVTALADLLGVSSDQLRASLSDLHAVVHVPDNDREPGLRTVHASFGDYLYGRAPSNIRISASLGHDILARGCLCRFTQDDLCFNISQSRSSFKPNREIEPGSIAPSLIYACLQWAHHIDAASNHLAFDEEVGHAFRSKFRFWLEVLSITRKVGLASGLLRIAGSAVSSSKRAQMQMLNMQQASLPTISQFLRDANTFVASSHTAISKSAPHIYTSALPFAAKDSLVYSEFASHYVGIVSVTTFGIDRHGGRLVVTLTGHEDRVNSVSYSSDGRLLASGSSDGTVRIWDTRTGHEAIAPLQSNDGKVFSVSFDPKYLLVISGGEGEAVHMWNASTGRTVLPPMRGHTSWIRSVAYSPDGMFIASGSDDKTVRLWSAETGIQVFVMIAHTGVIREIAFSPHGQLLASASQDKTVRLWSSDIGEPVGIPLTELEDEIGSIAFSPNGKWLVAGSQSSFQVRIWDLETLQSNSVVINNQGTPASLSFSPDGSRLVTARRRSIQYWDPQTGQELPGSSLAGHSDYVNSVTFSRDGLFLASGSKDHTVRIWDAAGSAKGAVEPLPAHSDSVSAVAVSSAGAFIVSGSGDDSVRVWDAPTGEEKSQPLLGHTGKVFAVAISPDDRLIASASADHSVRLWDVQTCGMIGEPLIDHDGKVHSVTFSPDCRWLASGSDDGIIHVREVATRKAVSFSPLRCNGAVLAVVFSPDGRIFAAGDHHGWVQLWQSGTNEPARAPLQANTSGVCSITFSPDGKRLASGGSDSVVHVWDVVAGHRISELKGHDQIVRSIAYSPDGLYLVSGSKDKTVRIWSTRDETVIATLFGHNNRVRSVAFTPDGRSIISGANDNTIHVWDVEAALSVREKAKNDPLARLGSASLNEEGWLVGESGELLLWLPGDYRGYMQLPPCSMIIGSHRVILAADDGIHWGEDWTACWRNRR